MIEVGTQKTFFLFSPDQTDSNDPALILWGPQDPRDGPLGALSVGLHVGLRSGVLDRVALGARSPRKRSNAKRKNNNLSFPTKI